MKNPKDSLQKAANAFGIDKLKPFQKKVCSILLDGHDVIALSGTGSGKSLCYQLPAYLHRNAYYHHHTGHCADARSEAAMAG